MKLKYLMVVGLCLAVINPLMAGDVDVSKLSDKKKTPQGLYLTGPEAYKLVTSEKDKVLFVDVRTQAEVEFVGAAKDIDANIPYMLNDFSEWDSKKKRYKKVPNSNFTIAIEDALKAKGLGKDDKIVLMCRSGSRSAKAANLLDKAGYKNVYSVVEGFEGDSSKVAETKGMRNVNGWKNDGLPWTYKTDSKKVYLQM